MITWEIEDYIREADFVNGKFRKIISPKFKTNDLQCPTIWKFILKTCHQMYIFSSETRLVVSVHPCTQSVKNAKFALYIKYGDNTAIQHVMDQGVDMEGGKSYDVMEKEIPDAYFVENTHWQGRISIRVQISVERADPLAGLPSVTPVGQRLFQTMQLSDVALLTGDQQLRAHRAVLAAKSKVFKDMFERKFKDEAKCEIDMSEEDSRLIREMLRFMYTEEVNNFESVAADLLPLAVKYDVEALRELCIAELHANMSVDTAIAAFLVASAHNIDCLKNRAADFIRTNYAALSTRREWDRLRRSPQLLAQI